MVDTLDTLWLMGLTNEFNDAKDWLKRFPSFDFTHTFNNHQLFCVSVCSYITQTCVPLLYVCMYHIINIENEQ
jgi:hypothetical protein